MEIDWKGKKEEVLFKEDIPFKTNNQMMREVSKTEIDELTGKSKSVVDRATYNELKLVNYIKKAPFNLDAKTIGELPTKLAMRLVYEVDKILKNNMLTDEDVKKS